MKELSIAIDIGTTNTKVSLIKEEDIEVIDIRKFRTYKEKDDFGELFDVRKIIEKIVSIIKFYLRKYPQKINSINIASVGEAGFLLNKNFKPITNAIAWYDTRSKKYIDSLSSEKIALIYKITGLPAHSNYVLSKIKWLIDNVKFSDKGPYVWANINDYLAYILSGELKTEYTLASRTMCYDIRRKVWSKEILDIFGLGDQVIFPEVCQSGTKIGDTSNSKVREITSEKIKVIISGHDHMVGAFGVHLKENELLNSTGTTEALLQIDKKSSINDINFKNNMSNGIYIDPSYYTLFASIPTGGIIFEWFQNLFELNYDDFNNMCNDIYKDYLAKGAFNLKPMIFIPHMQGSGAPFKNINSKGLIYGLDISKSKENILFSILTGLCLELLHVSKCFNLDNIDKLVVIGPATKNKLWLQIKADILNKTVVSVDVSEAVSIGSVCTSNTESELGHSKKTIIKPIKNNSKYYEEMYDQYKYLYESKIRLLSNSGQFSN